MSPLPNSTEDGPIDALVNSVSSRPRADLTFNGGDAVVEHRSFGQADKPEILLKHHYVLLWVGNVSKGEMAYKGGRYVPYRKYPNTLSSVVPGHLPAVRNTTPHSAIVCALKPKIVSSIDDGLDWRPRGTFHELRGQTDQVLQDLMRMLATEATLGNPCGQLYTESLLTALVVRLLHVGRAVEQPHPGTASALPLPLLRRVLERMEAGLDEDLGLQTLASVAGYSASQFLRMFRAATGQTPHRYLLDLRLTRARELLPQQQMSLIDIASCCGFSSQAHLATAFKRKFGINPSRYARSMQKSSSTAHFL